MIGDFTNFDKGVFFRDLTLCVLNTLESSITWVNHFTKGDVEVVVPFYYSLATGNSERFLFDAFTDDVASENRYNELNTDILPRASITLTGIDVRSDEFANPNVFLKNKIEDTEEIRTVLTKIRAVPVTVKYDMVILLTSEIDVFKCTQAIIDTLWIYRYMYFEYNYMNIDAVMFIPDSNQIEIPREANLTSDTTIKVTVSFEVHTYYPAYRKTEPDRSNMGPAKKTKWYDILVKNREITKK